MFATPSSTMEWEDNWELKPIKVSLQFTNRSVKHSRELIEDLLVKVDTFIFPIEFIVLDIEEDEEIALI